MSKSGGPDDGSRIEPYEKMCKSIEKVFTSPEPCGGIKRVISRSHGVDGALALVLANESGPDSQSRIANQPEIERSSEELEDRLVLLGE